MDRKGSAETLNIRDGKRSFNGVVFAYDSAEDNTILSAFAGNFEGACVFEGRKEFKTIIDVLSL